MTDEHLGNKHENRNTSPCTTKEEILFNGMDSEDEEEMPLVLWRPSAEQAFQEAMAKKALKRVLESRHQERMLTEFVKAVRDQSGDLIRVDETPETEGLRLEARVKVSGHCRRRERTSQMTASVTLKASQTTLEQTYICDGKLRRRPLIVMDLGDPEIEQALKEYTELPIWQKPMVVVCTDGDDPHQMALLKKLQANVRRLQQAGDPDHVAQSVVFLNPNAIITGASRDTSAMLLKAIFSRSSVCGLRLLQHLAARSGGFALRVHRHGDAAAVSSPTTSPASGPEDDVVVPRRSIAPSEDLGTTISSPPKPHRTKKSVVVSGAAPHLRRQRRDISVVYDSTTRSLL